VKQRTDDRLAACRQVIADNANRLSAAPMPCLAALRQPYLTPWPGTVAGQSRPAALRCPAPVPSMMICECMLESTLYYKVKIAKKIYVHAGFEVHKADSEVRESDRGLYDAREDG